MVSLRQTWTGAIFGEGLAPENVRALGCGNILPSPTPMHTLTHIPPRLTRTAPHGAALYLGFYICFSFSRAFSIILRKGFRTSGPVQAPHLTQKGTRAQREVVICPRLHSSVRSRKEARAQLSFSLSHAPLLSRSGQVGANPLLEESSSFP